MKDAERRAILARLIETREARAQFQKKTGYSKGRITQLLDKDQPFGERAAKNVAHRAGLPTDYFDNPEAALAPDLSVEERAQILTAWGKLDPKQREPKLKEIQVLAARNLDIAKHIGGLGLEIKHPSPDRKRLPKRRLPPLLANSRFANRKAIAGKAAPAPLKKPKGSSA